MTGKRKRYNGEFKARVALEELITCVARACVETGCRRHKYWMPR